MRVQSSLPNSWGQISRKNQIRFASTMFNHRTKTIQKNSAALRADSKHFDYLKKDVSKVLISRLSDIKNPAYPNCLDLGSDYNFCVNELQSFDSVQKIFHVHSVIETFKRDKEEVENYRVKPINIIAQENSLPFEDNTFDLVTSNLALHWSNDLLGTLKEIRRVLKPDGVFNFSIFGSSTLLELREAFMLAEKEREGGMSVHVSPFGGVSDYGNLLQQAGFALPTIDKEDIQIRYKDPFVLMHDLQGMGEGNAQTLRRKYVKKETLFAAAALYQSLFGNPDGSVPATYEIVYLIGWKPHHSQPKPLKRGTATKSFKDLGRGGGLD